jgi:GDPmannose 4,6-dehydratase
MTKKTALVTGVTGQDGFFLSQLLLAKGYRVFGSTRNLKAGLEVLQARGLAADVTLIENDLLSTISAVKLLETVSPDEIYHLSGQSSVGYSFEVPRETLTSIVDSTSCLLEALRLSGSAARMLNTASSECFGSSESPVTEATVFCPMSPYAVAKCSAYWIVRNYREAYGLPVSSGILFNHESQARPDKFVTRKIVRSAVEISRGSKARLQLGNLDIVRDWGWSGDYVDAMWRMLQLENPVEIIVATGQSYSLQDFVEQVFAYLELDWNKHVDADRSLLRPNELLVSRANPALASELLGWKAEHNFQSLIAKLVDHELAR